MKRGAFIVIDGLGGSGKTTQISYIKKRLGKQVLVTHEPGGTKRAEDIRRLLKSVATKDPDPLADFFLFWAARAEHMNEKIIPALKAGKTVICDRFDSSTFAMQVRGDKQKHLETLFWQCREHTLGKHAPSAYIILDVHHDVARARRGSRRTDEDRFDERESAYQKRVAAGYREFAQRVGRRAHVLDAHESKEALQEHIWRIVDRA